MDDPSDLHPLKVAISPLSYGPLADKTSSSFVLQALNGARFNLIEPNRSRQRTIDSFNSIIADLFRSMATLAPSTEGRYDFSAYAHDIFWLDLGEFIYALDRAFSACDAFGPFRSVTFSSRDFWTEVANADRAGLTTGRWRNVG